MRVRLVTPTYRFEFEGSPSLWNELFRPILGGPEAPPDPTPVATPAAAAVPSPAMAAAPAAPSWGARTAPAGGPAVSASVPPQHGQGGVRTFVLPRREAVRDHDRRDHDRRDDPRGPGAERADAYSSEADEGSGEWRRRRGGPEPTIPVEPTADPNVLYARLSEVDSRRAEKDAVLAAVWFVGRGQRDVSPEEVEKHLREHGGPADVKVRPHMQKHITRTKLMEPGEQNGWVRLSAKGRAQIRLLVGE